MNEEKEALEFLHMAFNWLAPSSTAQRALVTIRQEMERAGEPNVMICRMISDAIHTGLAYGNWPGDKHTVSGTL